MKKPAKAFATVRVLMEAEVSRQVRQHGRSSMKAEVCGVLIGREEANTTVIDACISGVNAAQGGAHVTFTQDTWQHIYEVKDKEYPDARIVGWYHSHPGFGVFLSDHDLFIHKNFFSSPNQIAWVYDPHTDEEGCFGWMGEKIEKVEDVSVRFEQPVGQSIVSAEEEEDVVKVSRPKKGNAKEESSWMGVLRDALVGVAFLLIGAGATFFYLSSKAHFIPRDTRAMIVVDGDNLLVVRPEVAEEIFGFLKTRADAMMKADQLPAASSQQKPPAAGPSSPEGENNGRKK